MIDAFTDAELRRVEEISQNASRPERGTMIDGWSVGLSSSKAKRSRCVNPFYASERSFETNLAAARDLYKHANLPCVFRLTRFISDPTIDEKLASLDAEKFDETHVQLTRISPNSIGRSAEFSVYNDYQIKMDLLPNSIGRTVQELRGDSDAEISALITRWDTMPFAIRSFAAIDKKSNELAAHVLTISEEHCVGIFDVITHTNHRGRGLATALIHRALAHAQENGASVAYLQVVATNSARRVYERLGFRTAYTYWYRQLPEL
jgi:N-acetylglutamate synthase